MFRIVPNATPRNQRSQSLDALVVPLTRLGVFAYARGRRPRGAQPARTAASAPRLELVFRNERVWIQCDGKSYPLGRNNLATMLGMAFGSNAPWQLG